MPVTSRWLLLSSGKYELLPFNIQDNKIQDKIFLNKKVLRCLITINIHPIYSHVTGIMKNQRLKLTFPIIYLKNTMDMPEYKFHSNMSQEVLISLLLTVEKFPSLNYILPLSY